MPVLEIPIKFAIGEKVYTTKQVSVEKACHVCEGIGLIDYKYKYMKCPECFGVGKFKTNKYTNVVCDELFEISSMKINVNKGSTTIKYKVRAGQLGEIKLNRSESNIFLSKEDAQKACDELNKEKQVVKLSEIIIKDSFLNTHPSLNKVQCKLEYYKQNNKFDKDIVLDRKLVLQDGYINYLIAKMLNLEVVKVVIE